MRYGVTPGHAAAPAGRVRGAWRQRRLLLAGVSPPFRAGDRVRRRGPGGGADLGTAHAESAGARRRPEQLARVDRPRAAVTAGVLRRQRGLQLSRAVRPGRSGLHEVELLELG